MLRSRTDLRSFLLVSGLTFTMLAGNFHVPGTDFEARYALLAGLLVVAVAMPDAPEPRPIGLIAGPLYAWAGWLALSRLWSPNNDAGYVVGELLFLIAVLAVAVHAARTVEYRSLDLVWTLFVGVGALYFLIALVSETTVQGRLAVPGGGPNVFARVMVIAAIAAVVLAIQRRVVWPMCFVLLFAVGAVMSGSRGGVLGGLIVVVLAMIPLFLSLKGGTRFLVALFGAGLPLVTWGYLRDLGPVSSVLNYFNERFVGETLVENYSSGRDVITPEAWTIFLDNRVIGAGLDAWPVVQQTGIDYEHPHNLFLSSGVDGGIIAVVLAVASLLVPLVAVWYRRPLNAGAWGSLAASLAVFVSAMFSGYHYDSRLIWFFLIWALAYVSSPCAVLADRDVSEKAMRRSFQAHE